MGGGGRREEGGGRWVLQGRAAGQGCRGGAAGQGCSWGIAAGARGQRRHHRLALRPALLRQHHAELGAARRDGERPHRTRAHERVDPQADH